MYSLLFATVVSFAAAMLATRVCRRMCIRFGIVDKPDRVRKLHARPVPRVGGIAVAIALFVAYSTLLFLPGRGGDLLSLQLGLALRLAPAALIVFLTGLIDDLISLSPRWKLLGQTSTAIYAWTVGLRIHALAGIPIGEIASLCLTVLWLLICCNALNLIDGLDGLAAGIGLLATLAALGAALLHGNIELVLATAPLAGAL